MLSWVTYRGSADGTILESLATRGYLINDEVLVNVKAAGLCGRDEHCRKRNMVLGHEGVGIVTDVAPEVQFLKPGDRVGWGYQHDSCKLCKDCLSSNEIYCDGREIFGESNLDQGAFATHMILSESYLFLLPDSISSIEAAPLMCAGATVFSALEKASPNPGDRVGVFGMGGLGHLAIQFAALRSCRVVVFSGNRAKEPDAIQLGAEEFHVISPNGFTEAIKPLNVLLVTSSGQPDWHTMTQYLASNCKIMMLTIKDEDIEFPLMPLVTLGLSIAGSVGTSRHDCIRMLEAVDMHGIRPMIETFSLNAAGVTESMSLLREGNIWYRAVLVQQDQPPSVIDRSLSNRRARSLS